MKSHEEKKGSGGTTYRSTSVIFVTAFISAALEKYSSIISNDMNNWMNIKGAGEILLILIFVLFLTRLLISGMTKTPKKDTYSIVAGAVAGLSLVQFFDIILKTKDIFPFCFITISFIIWFYIIFFPIQSRIERIKG